MKDVPNGKRKRFIKHTVWLRIILLIDDTYWLQGSMKEKNLPNNKRMLSRLSCPYFQKSERIPWYSSNIQGKRDGKILVLSTKKQRCAQMI
jgi:hypothetical protein